MSFDEELMVQDYDDGDDVSYDSNFTAFTVDTVALLKCHSSSMTAGASASHYRSRPVQPLDCRPLIVGVVRVSRPPKSDDFTFACSDESLIFSPRELGFIPAPWPDHGHTFGDLVSNFFTRKSSATTRFLHKLVNALKIVEYDDKCYKLVGLAWVTDDILKIDKVKFARLIGVRTIDPSLFHKQGNFPTHGFTELCLDDAKAMLSSEELVGVDFDVVRLVKHETGAFTKRITPGVEDKCKWNGAKKETKRIL
jgi:hypothetical protein